MRDTQSRGALLLQYLEKSLEESRSFSDNNFWAKYGITALIHAGKQSVKEKGL